MIANPGSAGGSAASTAGTNDPPPDCSNDVCVPFVNIERAIEDDLDDLVFSSFKKYLEPSLNKIRSIVKKFDDTLYKDEKELIAAVQEYMDGFNKDLQDIKLELQDKVYSNDNIPLVYLDKMPHVNRCLYPNADGTCDPVHVRDQIFDDTPTLHFDLDACIPPYTLDPDTKLCENKTGKTVDKTLAFIPNSIRSTFWKLYNSFMTILLGGSLLNMILLPEIPEFVPALEGCFDPLHCANVCMGCAEACLNNGKLTDQNVACLTKQMSGTLVDCAQHCGRCSEYIQITDADVAAWWATNSPIIQQLASSAPLEVPPDCTPAPTNVTTNQVSEYCPMSVPCQKEVSWGGECSKNNVDTCGKTLASDGTNPCVWNSTLNVCSPSCCYAKCWIDNIPLLT